MIVLNQGGIDMSATKKQLATLRRYYRIKGDGVAQLNLEKAVKSKQFKATMEALASVKLDEPEREQEAGLVDT